MSGATEEVTTTALGLVPLFHHVDEAALATLIREASSRHLKAGEWLFHEGDEADGSSSCSPDACGSSSPATRAENGEGARPGSSPRRAGAPDRIRALGRCTGGARLPTPRDRPPVVRRPARKRPCLRSCHRDRARAAAAGFRRPRGASGPGARLLDSRSIGCGRHHALREHARRRARRRACGCDAQRRGGSPPTG